MNPHHETQANPVLRIAGIIFVFGVVSTGWLILGGSTTWRTEHQSGQNRGRVADLWGNPQAQAAPSLAFHWTTHREVTHTEQDENRKVRVVRETLTDEHDKAVAPASTEIAAALHLDERRKGLLWYSLYDVGFDGAWTYVHHEAEPGTLGVKFTFPDQQAIYDDFQFIVDGKNRAGELRPKEGVVTLDVPVHPAQSISLRVTYRSRGLDQWTYIPTSGVDNLESFHVALSTDFADIDFPAQSMSPSSKSRTQKGWRLDWDFRQVLTGRTLGLVMPSRLQPGELASALSFSAPISLLFFFLVLFVLGTLRNIDIHPINYLFIGGAFFAFHLLFAYSIDHLTVVPAFILAAATSLILVISYLRLVVSARFALVEAAAAQAVYLIGFSLAHFFEGYTGLTVTVLSIVTLFLLMQWTGKIRWSEVLAKKKTA